MEFDAYRLEWMNGKPGDHSTIEIHQLPAIYAFSIVGNAPGKVYIDGELLEIVLYQSIYFFIEVQVNYLFIVTLVDISHDYPCKHVSATFALCAGLRKPSTWRSCPPDLV